MVYHAFLEVHSKRFITVKETTVMRATILLLKLIKEIPIQGLNHNNTYLPDLKSHTNISKHLGMPLTIYFHKFGIIGNSIASDSPKEDICPPPQVTTPVM